MMAVHLSQCLISLFLFTLTVNSAISGVPVLLWEASSSNDKHDLVPALFQLDTDEFSNHILKKIHVHRPLIVVFLEETLSVEDFSWQDVQHQGSFPQMRNLTKMSPNVEFIPSVEYPLDALKSLEVSHNYLWKKYDRGNIPTKGGVILEVRMEDPLANEDRPDLLRRHDVNIAEIYSKLLSKHSSIVAIFTGKQSSWVELETNRVRREAEESGNTSLELKGNTTSDFFSVYPFDVPVIKINNETIPLVSPDCCQTDDRTNFSRLLVKYTIKNAKNESKPFKFRYKFEKEEDNKWKLSLVEFENDQFSKKLYPDSEIETSLGRSVRYTTPVTFRSEDNETELRFKSGFQTQAFMKTQQLDEPVKNEVVFFTPGIWSGLIVSFILGLILIWGIVMLMDIRTMDRFDDPKGKTIATAVGD